ncbi:MAG: hypothetical protein QXR91_04920 [Nitrososphaerales archaeon]
MSRILSLTIASLLILASFAGLSLVAPVGVASAAAPTITLSASSGPAAIVDPAGNTILSSTVIVDGSGFPAGQTGITIRIASSGTTPSPTAGTQLRLDRPTIQTVGANTVDADANGKFRARIHIIDTTNGEITGGSKVIFAVYTPAGGVATATDGVPFTVTASVVIKTAAGATSGSFGDRFNFYCSGFDASEAISLTPAGMFTGVPAAVAATGAVDTATVITLGAVTGGSKTVTLSGASSGRTATTTITVYSSIALVDSTATNARISVPATAPATFYLQGWGFPASTTIASSNTITIGGKATIHGAITTDASGRFGVPTPVSVTFTENLAMGPVSIVLGGTTFSWDNGNIQAYNPANGAPGFGTTTAAFRGVILASNAQGATAYSLATLQRATGNYSVGDTVYVFVVGQAAARAFATITLTDPSGAGVVMPTVTLSDATGASGAPPLGTTTTITAANVDDNGAGYFTFALPSTYGANTLAMTFAGAGPAAPPTLTISVKPAIQTASGSIRVGSIVPVTGTGFDPADNGATFTVVFGDGSSWGTFTATIAANGNLGPNILPALPEKAYGSYQVNISGTRAGNWAWLYSTALEAYSINVRPVVFAGALNIAAGAAGDKARLQSGAGVGVHNLKANTQYTIAWDGPYGTTTLGSFTSTAEGTIPLAGVEFTIPEAVVGTHLIDIREAGTSALYGIQILAPGAVGQYDNLQFAVQSRLTCTPSVGGVGTEVTISGSGLRASTTYYIVVRDSTATTVPAGAVSATSFTSTATGSVPAGVKITIQELPTAVPGTGGSEAGETYNILAATAGQLQTAGAAPDGVGQFILQATATLSATTATPGKSITVTAKGLRAGQAYNILWNFRLNPAGNAYLYTIVGALASNAVGSGTATFTVPSDATPGQTYTVTLLRPGDVYPTVRINAPPTVTVVEAVAPPTVAAPTVTPAQPRVNQPITVSTTITPATGATITSAKLYYQAVGATTWTELSMTAVGNTYSATIPAQTTAGTVSYYIEVKDSADNTVRVPTTGANTITVTTAPPVTGTTAENTVSGTQLTNAVGSPITAATVGSEVYLKAAVTNNDATTHTRWLIIQVKGPDGAIVSPGGIIKQQVTLPPGTAVSTLVNFTPRTAGTYTVEVFVFTDLAQPVSVAEKVTWTFTAA